MIKVENMLEKYGIKLENGLETKIKDAGIDSLIFVRLIIDIETEYEITFPDEELNQKAYVVVGDIEKYANSLFIEKEK